LADDEPTVRRQFRVLKDNGEHWDMNFTNAGLRWERSDASDERLGMNDGPTPALGGSVSPAAIIGEVINTATNIGMWWETRQHRLLSEAMNDESRRISWLAEMIARWGDAHRDGDQLDLRVSEYLARETREMMDAIVANKRIALPQSMLYELEMIQDTLRSFRAILLAQFETLSSAGGINIDSVVRNALPGARLDMTFIRSLGKDPSVEWAERVRLKTTGDFERELTEALRQPSTFLALVFPRTEPTTPEQREEAKTTGVMDKLVGLLAPALPRLLATDLRPDGSERRDAFRELSLLPAEVARVKALNSAWLATSVIVEASSGAQMQVRVSTRGLSVEMAPVTETPRRAVLEP
jgi:hypothetical protein